MAKYGVLNGNAMDIEFNSDSCVLNVETKGYSDVEIFASFSNKGVTLSDKESYSKQDFQKAFLNGTNTCTVMIAALPGKKFGSNPIYLKKDIMAQVHDKQSIQEIKARRNGEIVVTTSSYQATFEAYNIKTICGIPVTTRINQDSLSSKYILRRIHKEVSASEILAEFLNVEVPLKQMEISKYFIFSSHIEDFIFKGFTVSSVGAFIAVCVGVAIFICLYEVLKSIRQQLVTMLVNFKEDPQLSASRTESQKFLLNWISRLPRRTKRRIKFHCLQSVLYVSQVAMGYFVMLIVMSYNAWFLLTVAFTSGLCYYFHDFLFSRRQLILPIEVSGPSV